MRFVSWLRQVFSLDPLIDDPPVSIPEMPDEHPGDDPVDGPIGDLALEVITAINAIRVEHGRTPLSLSSVLCALSQEHASYMDDYEELTHIGFTDRLVRSGMRRGAENIAAGHRTVNSVVRGWHASIGHRRNQLGSYTHCGVGKSGNYWCVMFGS